MMAPHVVTLRKAWRDSGMSLAKIAELAGISENTTSAIMAGRNSRWASLVAVCQVLGVTSLTTTAATSCGNTSINCGK